MAKESAAGIIRDVRVRVIKTIPLEINLLVRSGRSARSFRSIADHRRREQTRNARVISEDPPRVTPGVGGHPRNGR